MALNRTDVIAGMAERTQLSKGQCDAALNALQDVLVAALQAGDPVRLQGLLTLERTQRAARSGRNPRTGESLTIPAGPGVKLSAGSALKDAVKG